MALIRGCSRCGTGWPTITHVRTPTGPVEVRLCTGCRLLAAGENAAAQTRSTGADPIPGSS